VKQTTSDILFIIQINLLNVYFLLGRKGPDIVDQYARWVVLAWILTFRSVCKPLRDKFPNLTAIQTSGYISL
jgi:hypothetical protein